MCKYYGLWFIGLELWIIIREFAKFVFFTKFEYSVPNILIFEYSVSDVTDICKVPTLPR